MKRAGRATTNRRPTPRSQRKKVNLAPAVPGAGKSTLVLEDVRHAVSLWKIDPSQILVVTFGTRAADDLSQRMQTAGIEGVEARTQHAFGAALVHQDPLRFGFTGEPRIVNAQEEREYFEQAFHRYFRTNPPVTSGDLWHAYLEHSNHIKRLSKTLDDKGVRQHEIRRARKFLQYYRRWMCKKNLLGFEDMVRLPLEALDDPAFAAEVADRIKLLAIDEYQDMNGPQRRLLGKLIDVVETSLVVGDDLQSIYQFRGATANAMDKLQRKYPKAHVIPLDCSYRLTKENAKLTNRVLARQGVATRIRGTGSGPAPSVRCARSRDEMFWQALKTTQELLDAGTVYSDIAIVAPTNRTAALAARYCTEQGIPFHYLGKEDEGIDLLTRFQGFLQALKGPVGLKWLLVREVEVTSRQAKRMADPSQPIPKDLKLPQQQVARCRKYRKAIEFTRTDPHVDRVLTVFARVFQGKEAHHPRKTTKHQLANYSIPLQGNLASIRKHLNALLATDGETVGQRSRNEAAPLARQTPSAPPRRGPLSQRSQPPGYPQAEAPQPGITVTTIHGAKGGEWQHVLLLDVYDEAYRWKGPKEQMFNQWFVAITRAKHQLHLYTLVQEVSYQYQEGKIEDGQLKYRRKKPKWGHYRRLRFLPPYHKIKLYCEYKSCKRIVKKG